jgi:PQQ system protein
MEVAMKFPASLVLVALAAPILSGCGMMRLGQGMLVTNEPNEKVLAQMFATGGGGKAEKGSDGVMRIVVEHHPMETVFRPAVILLDHPGELEIDFVNRNPQSHLLPVVPSDGNLMALDLPALATGRTRVRLSSPGLYMFGDAMGDHMGRGMMGMIVVGGEVPSHAKLDRPPQPRP